MLILSRRPEEVIVIDTNIKVRVLAIQGNQVRIGIDAPKEIQIVREELLYRSKHKKEEVA